MSCKGISYSFGVGYCQHNECLNEHGYTKEGLFKIKNLEQIINVCTKCIKKYPNLLLWSQGVYVAKTANRAKSIKIMENVRNKIYILEGVYKKTLHQKHQYSVDKHEEIIKDLDILRDDGYSVPLFGRYDSLIGVTASETRTDEDFNRVDNLRLKLVYWENIQKGTKGYNIELA